MLTRRRPAGQLLSAACTGVAESQIEQISAMPPDADDTIVLGRFAWGVPMRAVSDWDRAGRPIAAASSEVS